MPRRLFIALLLLVIAPLVLLGWMSAKAVQESQELAKKNLANLLSSQLYDADRRIVNQFDRYAAHLNSELESGVPIINTLRRLRRDNPIVRQGILVSKDGRLLFPGPADTVVIDAREVAAALPAMIDARPLPVSSDSDAPDPRVRVDRIDVAQFPVKTLGKSQSVWTSESAWQNWYMGGGVHVIYWRARTDGTTVGLLLERSRWLADVIALLPDDPADGQVMMSSSRIRFPYRTTRYGIETSLEPTPIGGIALVDESRRLIYHWGGDVLSNRVPLSAIELSPPLSSWKLQLHTGEGLISEPSLLPLYLSLGSLALLLLAVGAYVLSSVQRQIQTAKSRVSFAGQVSHELRTPLTNIRLYTELAESDLEKLAEEPSGEASSQTRTSLSKRLEVIDHESRRLQRLVSGVLEMIRPSGKRTGVRRQPTDVCVLIGAIADQFMPSFEAAGLKLHVSCDVPDLMEVDPDVLELVLVNLLSNVEKYVPRGGGCWITCHLRAAEAGGQELRILVEDDGPGISRLNRGKVFRAFVRLDDSIQAPSGTGIGLTIARRATTRHGGTLELLADPRRGGASFEILVPLSESTA